MNNNRLEEKRNGGKKKELLYYIKNQAIRAILLALTGMPLAFAIGLSSMLFLLLDVGLPLSVMAQMIFSGVDSFHLMAIPFFILAGSLMNQGGLTQRLIDFSNALVGHYRGALDKFLLSQMFFSVPFQAQPLPQLQQWAQS